MGLHLREDDASKEAVPVREGGREGGERERRDGTSDVPSKRSRLGRDCPKEIFCLGKLTRVSLDPKP